MKAILTCATRLPPSELMPAASPEQSWLPPHLC